MFDLSKLESLVSQGAIYGWEMVLVEVDYLIWANMLILHGGIVLFVIALILFASIPILSLIQQDRGWSCCNNESNFAYVKVVI